jgi:hypothetical protein
MYACVNPTDPNADHCYGKVGFRLSDLIGPQGFLGFTTMMTPFGPLIGGDGELTDELWVRSADDLCRDGKCWIEVGIIANAGYLPRNETHVFWADNRPNSTFFFHDLGPVQRAEYGKPIDLNIFFIRTPPFPYGVSAVVCATQQGDCFSRILVGRSTSNTMVPDSIDIGLELAGTTGANGPGATFESSRVDSTVGSKLIDQDGTVRQDWPAAVEWLTPPSAQHGGVLHTDCCTRPCPKPTCP